MAKSNPGAYERRLRAQFVRRAMQDDTPLLASSLARYATREGQSWEELASSLACSIDDLNQIALCRPPRAESFVEDVQAIADRYVDPDRLLLLLRRLQVLTAFAKNVDPAVSEANAAPDRAMLLAARDREEASREKEAPQTAEENPPTEGETDHA